MLVRIVIGFTILVKLADAVGCLNHYGQQVDWWAILKVPPKVGKSGFGYIDSRSAFSTFEYIPYHVDEGATALTMTFLQINQYSLQSVAWNDEKPNNQTSTSLAHSKGLMAFTSEQRRGFLVTHSIPKYPAFNNHQIDVKISQSQNFYGQHLLCLSLSQAQLNKIAYRLLITRVYIYQSNIRNQTSSNYLYDLATGKTQKVDNLFQTQQFMLNPNTKLKSIYKNGFENCSIFEDGLIQYLKVNLIAQTWGRPLQPAWCTANWQVNNVIQILVGDVNWFQADDHSKWVLAGQTLACFGDMNRMTSQWKRGGAFFCLQSILLANALKRVIIQKDKCTSSFLNKILWKIKTNFNLRKQK